jgi:hypothetical protein
MMDDDIETIIELALLAFDIKMFFCGDLDFFLSLKKKHIICSLLMLDSRF